MIDPIEFIVLISFEPMNARRLKGFKEPRRKALRDNPR